MKIAIVDDEKKIREKINEKIHELYKDIDIYEFEDGVTFLKDTNTYDIVLLDIDMPKMDGIEVSKQLDNKVEAIIFVTSVEDRVFEAFGFNVYAYIKKEEWKTKLPVALKKVMDALDKNKITLKTTDGYIKILPQKINFIRKENRKIYLYSDYATYQLCNKTLSELNLKDNFIYLGQSCIVNLDKIIDIHEDSVTLENMTVLEISRKRLKEVKQAFAKNRNNKMWGNKI